MVELKQKKYRPEEKKILRTRTRQKYMNSVVDEVYLIVKTENIILSLLTRSMLSITQVNHLQ